MQNHPWSPAQAAPWACVYTAERSASLLSHGPTENHLENSDKQTQL